MDEILSQSEIDMLLSALTSGELNPEDLERSPDKDNVKNYDFRRPNKFSKDQLRTLYLLHDNLGRLISNFLSGYLRTNIQVKIASVEQLTYEDFIISVPTPTLLTIFNLDPLPGSAIFETNSTFIFPIIDLLFGGTGLMPKRVRELTDIELGVIRNLYSKLLENVDYVWSDIYEVKASLQSLETNPQLSQVISPNETVVVITFSTTINDNQGLINLCLPYMQLEPVLSKLSSRHWFASGEGIDTEVYKQKIKKKLDQAEVNLTALCGQSQITVREFLKLQVGDIIALDNQVGEDMVLLVEDRPKFKIQPGVVGKKMAIQVTAFATKEAQDN